MNPLCRKLPPTSLHASSGVDRLDHGISYVTAGNYMDTMVDLSKIQI
jgi:hypothetical protein